jgi:hypothetical protein
VMNLREDFGKTRHYNPPVRKDIFFSFFLYRSGEGIRVSFNFFSLYFVAVAVVVDRFVTFFLVLLLEVFYVDCKFNPTK